MVKGPLADRLEYAILETVVRVFGGRHQESWGGWQSQISAHGIDISEFTYDDLLSAFKRLRNRGVLRLTKPDSQRYHAHEYSGNEADDDKFFFKDPFNAVVTDEGRSYWDSIREEPKRPIGFSP